MAASDHYSVHKDISVRFRAYYINDIDNGNKQALKVWSVCCLNQSLFVSVVDIMIDIESSESHAEPDVFV